MIRAEFALDRDLDEPQGHPVAMALGNEGLPVAEPRSGVVVDEPGPLSEPASKDSLSGSLNASRFFKCSGCNPSPAPMSS